MAARGVAATILLSALAASPSAQKLADPESRREALRHYRAGQELMAAEKFARAAEEFQQAIDSDRLFTLAHYFLGQAYGSQRRYASAIEAYQSCIEACRAIYQLRQSDRAEFDRRRDEQIRAMMESASALRLWARRLPTNDRLNIWASDVEHQALGLERTSMDAPFQPPAEVLLALGSAFYHLDQFEQAEYEWRASLEVNPKLGEAHNNLAVLCMRTGRIDEAGRELRLAEKCGVRVNPQLKKDVKAARTSK